MRKILQLSNYYYPEVGGIEKIAQLITKALKGSFDIKVVCFTHEREDRTDYIDGIEIKRFGSKMKIASQQVSFTILFELKKIIELYNPDYIIIHLPNPFLDYLLQKCLKQINKNIKIIVYWHSDIVKQRIGEKLFRKQTLKLLKGAYKIVCTSPNYIDGSYYLSMFRSKCVVVPNCVDEDNLKVTKEVENGVQLLKEKYKDKIICVGIGRQVPYKGFEYLIEAMKRIDNKYELFLLGRKGESTSSIKKESKNLPNIHLVGEVSDLNRKIYLAACDIFCFPSITKNEAFGIALAEGMYFDKPAITFTIPGSGVNYVNLNKETGIEVPNRDIMELSKAIQFLGEDRSTRLEYGKNAGKRVRDLFLYKHFKENIKSILE